MPTPVVIATLGRRHIENVKELVKLCEGGADWLRINMSHTNAEEAEDVVGWVRRRYPKVKLLQDLQGPKLRVGKMRTEVRVKGGDELVLCPQPVYDKVSPRDRERQKVVPVATPFPFERLGTVPVIRLKDGEMELRVERYIAEEQLVVCDVVAGGVVRSEKGMNAPGVDRSGMGLQARDMADIRLGARLRFDAVCASFVTGRAELDATRELAAKTAPDWKPAIWAKVECKEAMDALEEIVAACDAVLIGRGDLAAELGGDEDDVHDAALSIARKVVGWKRTCHVGTKLLESMRTATTPSEAEVEALGDYLRAGVVGYLLTAETSVGDHPVEAIAVVRKVAAKG